MKQFYETYCNADEKLAPLVREISWTNHLIILGRTKSIEEKAFYLQLCIKERLSKRELERQIDSALYERTKIRLTVITSYGLKHNIHSSEVAEELTMDDLFAE